MTYSRPVTEIMRQRFSCRTYLEQPIAEEQRRLLADFTSSSRQGPCGAPVRFKVVAATEQGRNPLQRLGTYGFIKGAKGFIVGAVGHSDKNLEDYGYLMERAILFATDMGLGTCWLGGTFTKSSFAAKISATDGELVPAVTSIGYIADQSRSRDSIRRRVCFAARDGAVGTVCFKQAAVENRQGWECLALVPAANPGVWRCPHLRALGAGRFAARGHGHRHVSF